MTPQITTHSPGSAGSSLLVLPAHHTRAADSPNLPSCPHSQLHFSNTFSFTTPFFLPHPLPTHHTHYPSAHTTAPNPLSHKVPQNSPATSPHLTLSYTSSPPTPPPSQQTQTTTKLNTLQHNIDGITNKIQQFKHHLLQHNIHIAAIQETKLKDRHNATHLNFLDTQHSK